MRVFLLYFSLQYLLSLCRHNLWPLPCNKHNDQTQWIFPNVQYWSSICQFNLLITKHKVFGSIRIEYFVNSPINPPTGPDYFTCWAYHHGCKQGVVKGRLWDSSSHGSGSIFLFMTVFFYPAVWSWNDIHFCMTCNSDG